MAMLITFQILASLIAVWIIFKLLQRVPPPIHGHYAQKTAFHNVKKWLVYVYLKLFVRRKQLLSEWNPKSDPSVSGYGIVASEEEERLEARNDAVEFCCSDAEGNSLIGGVDARAETGFLCLRLHGEELRLPLHPQTAPATQNFSAAGFTLQPIEPLRKWKLTFSGFLRKQSKNESNDIEETVVSGSFKFIWTPFHQELISSKDHRNEWLMAEAIAKERWTPEFWRRLKGHHPNSWHEQWGMLEGKIRIEGKDDEIHLILRGKKRRTNHPAIPNTIHKRVVIDIYAKDGTVIHFNSESFKVGLTENSFGYVIYCDGNHQQLKSYNFSLANCAENQIIPKTLNLKLTTKQRDYDVDMTIATNTKFQLIGGTKRDQETFYYSVTATVNGYQAWGFIRFDYPHHHELPITPPPAPLLLQEVKTIDRKQLAVPLTDINCRNGELVGGKAMSLGLMTTIKSPNFIVPKGLCVTVTAYWEYLKANSHLMELIKNLQLDCVNDVTKMQSQCDRVVESMAKAEVTPSIMKAVRETMAKIFGANWDEKRFAVRSSAVGEDGEETSSAGQNETFLGVKGYDKLCVSISKCWASQFGFQAVQYRRQHGQAINCGMGVVVQEMVNSEVAGVLFTREPITGNVARMLITASYGLGESVVSALCDPDTIYIQRTWRDEVSVHKRDLGHKQSLITMNETESGTTKLEPTKEQMSKCCVDDALAIQLAHVGILLENAFGGPRDIEWAYSNGNLYLLQSRAVTNLDMDEDWSLVSELNGAPVSCDEICTTANVSEVMPGALTPLTIMLFQTIIDRALKVFRRSYSPTSIRFFAWESMGIYGNHLFLNLSTIFNAGVNRELSSQDIGIGHSLLGRNVYEGGLHEVILHRYGSPSPINQLIIVLPALRQLIYGGSKYRSSCRHAFALAKSRFVFNDSHSSAQIYAVIDKDLSPLYQVVYSHLEASSASSIWAGIIISILTSNDKEFKDSHLSDLANLLGNCSNVVSADVPAAIDNLTATMATLPTETKDFLKNTSEEKVLHWLKTDVGKAGQEFKSFMETHGHRGFREMEFLSKSWTEEPTTLINVLQTCLKSESQKKAEKKTPLSLSETIDSLQTPLPKLTKLIMRYLLMKIKKAVGYRENMKSNLVRMCGLYRAAYRTLGRRMVEEGRLPEPDLVFYLTHYEIGQLIGSRSARLLSKAIRRRAIHPRLERLHFPSMVYGYPQLNLEDDDADNKNLARKSDLVLKATCASRGRCRGIARVVDDIHQASTIQAGDILITYATDICWSPYFPLLSGIVTELGGLVSHGAVVAREYGLPCLIAAENARKLFRSGDEVLLDASKGTIELITSA